MNKKNLAFTFIEAMLTMIIVGFLLFLTAKYAFRFSVDTEKAKFKKGYANIERAVGTLINDSAIYGSTNGFRDLSKADLKLGDSEDNIVELGQVIGENPNEKFRDSFKYFLNAVKSDINCDLYHSNTSNACFATDDGIVYGIPDTDFRNSGMINITDSEGDDIKVAPITMYVNYNGDKKDPKKDSFIIGVEYNGTLHFIKTVNDSDCYANGKKDKPKYIQCKLEDYIESDGTNIATVNNVPTTDDGKKSAVYSGLEERFSNDEQYEWDRIESKKGGK